MSVGLENANLVLEATRADLPEGVDPVDAAAIKDERIGDALTDAAESGSATTAFSYDRVDPGLEEFRSLFAEFSYDEIGDKETVFVTVDETPVKIDLTSGTIWGHGDSIAEYEVSERIVRRGEYGFICGVDVSTRDPKSTALVECRSLE
ncbi:hypothetical protein [Halovenus sp. HT40]|uniref:hypothetical protein n=1 Tax=Halovenus sp. HT40 TaxID=3126691 RepID=UPI00300EFD24